MCVCVCVCGGSMSKILTYFVCLFFGHPRPVRETPFKRRYLCVDPDWGKGVRTTLSPEKSQKYKIS